MAQNEYAVRLEHVTKTFGPVVANKDVSLGVRRGEILALLGENGSGKTTLMNMIAGIYFPDEGEIYVGDKAATIRSPRDALDLGIGMIHQHFKLVDVFSATENIALSMGSGEKFDLKKVHDKARAICEKYEFALDLDQKVYEMSVSQKQTLEIVKVLYRGADILILDEPTAVLTPQETEKLFSVIRNMKADGKAVIIITHKLHEVLSISDRVAILRKGEYVGDIATKDADEAKLTEMMVGEKVELTDTVSYTNIEAGVEHTVTGTLMDKTTGAPLSDGDGNPLSSSVTFTPEEKDGTVEVKFTVDTTHLDGHDLVAFETLTTKETETDRETGEKTTVDKTVAEHKDIDDANQTVTVTSDKSSMAQTGRNILIGAAIAAAVAAGAGGTYIYRKRHQIDDADDMME